MRQDVINKRGTEIDFINGYVVKLGKKLELSSSEYKVNQIVVNLHKLKCEMIKRDGANWNNTMLLVWYNKSINLKFI